MFFLAEYCFNCSISSSIGGHNAFHLIHRANSRPIAGQQDVPHGQNSSRASSSTARNLKVFALWLTIFRNGMLARNCPILFRIGEMAADQPQAEYLSYSENQKARICGCLTFSRTVLRKSPPVRSRGMSKSVLPGYPSRPYSRSAWICRCRFCRSDKCERAGSSL